MSNPSVQLQGFCRMIQGGRHGLSGNNFVPEGFPAYGAGGLNGYLPEYEFDEPAVILSAIGARCGKCFYADGKWTSLANTQLIFPDPTRADARFLWFQLNDERRWHRSGTGQPFIKPADVKAHRVYLPPLPEQRRIAEILDKADALRAKRRAALAQLNTLTQSIFLDMFGDPIANQKGWKTCLLETVAKKITDGTHKTPTYQESGVEFLSAKDLKDGRIEWDTGKFISEAEHKELVRRCDPELGDVLLAKSGSLGSVAIIDRAHDFSLFESLCLIKHDRTLIEGQFLTGLLRTSSMLAHLLSKNKGVAIKHLHLVDVRNLRIPLPPISMQREFSRRIAMEAQLRTTHRESLAELDTLFASLQYRAFEGEL